MRKKIAVILIVIAMMTLIGGCGSAKAAKVTGATLGVTKGMATEAINKATEKTHIEDVTAEGSDEVIVNEDENSEADNTEADEFLTVCPCLEEQDRSDDYGVYSTSCYDLDQYLDENNEATDSEIWGDKALEEYSGRWIYPELTPCKFFNELFLSSRTDLCERYRCKDESGINISILVSSGLGQYHYSVGLLDAGIEYPYEYMFTAQTTTGETDVIHRCYSAGGGTCTVYDGDGNVIEEGEDEEYMVNAYSFNVGNFSIDMYYDNEKTLTEEEVQLIIDNIRITSGRER